MSGRRPLRILQVVGGLGLGGTETWLLHVLRNIDRKQFQMDFVVHVAEPRAYDAEVIALGSKVLQCVDYSNLVRYSKRLVSILHEHGPYDIVHSHVQGFNGIVLSIARLARIPVRIAHSHNDTRSEAHDAGVIRRMYLACMRRAIWWNSTTRLAASRDAAAALFGVGWERDDQSRVLHCGLDLSACAEPVDRGAVRNELGVPLDALVVGHVGRFVLQKNHAQVVKIVGEMVRRNPRVYGLLVGGGPLKAEIVRQVAEAGLGERILFAGERLDVPRLLRGAMDVFLFPSLYEGLGLAVVEAQAAGLRAVVATTVPCEVEQSSLISWLPLEADAAVWAERAIELATLPRDSPPLTTGWPSDLRTSLSSLEEVYKSAVHGNGHKKTS